MDVVDFSSSKKNPRGKFISSGQKQKIVNLYKDKLKQQLDKSDSPRMNYREMIIEISKSSGIGQRTVQTTLSEYKNKGTVSSPNRKKTRPTIIEKVDDSDKSAIRRKIHSFWFNREIPTISKVLIAINEDTTLPNFKRSSFQNILKDLQFVYTKKFRNSTLLEKNDIVNWRRRYLERIRHYRQQNRPIYYLDETWVNAGETHNKTTRTNNTVNSLHDEFNKEPTTDQKVPSEKGKRLIVLHIGSIDGFVPGGLLCFESKTNSVNYHDEINGDIFFEWFVKMLPLLQKNAVIVMDNAPYHSMKKDPVPTMSWKKQDIINWLDNRGEIITNPIVKSQLLEKVESLKPQYDKYLIDEYAKDNNKIILRLPPYHCELNPIELAWSSIRKYVRTHNDTLKLQDVHELLISGVKHTTKEMWTNFVGHVVKEEEKFWNIDFVIDEIMDEEPGEGQHVLTIKTSDTSSNDSDSD